MVEVTSPATAWPQRTLRMPEQPNLRARQLGDRLVTEVPIAELRYVLRAHENHDDRGFNPAEALSQIYGLEPVAATDADYISAVWSET